MQISISRDAFVSGLASVQGVVETRKTLPILSHLLLEAEAERISLFGTDLDVGLVTWLDAEVSGSGAVALSARKLYEIVRELPEAPVELTVDADLSVTLRCFRSEFRMRGLSKEDFPSLPRVVREGGFLLKRQVLQDMMRKTLFAASTDPTRYTLNGVLLQLLPSEVKMVATDGHRLSLVTRGRDAIEGEGTLEALIPRKAVTETLKLLKDGEGEVHLQCLDNQLLLKLEHSLLTCRLIEGQFPNYQQVIPKGGTRTLIVHREAFQGALKRTSAIIGDRPLPTTFELKPGKILLSCVNVDLGEAREELEAEYTGEAMTIGFNTKYILEFLAVVEEEEIRVQFNDPLSPALFRPVGDGGFSCVIMPMRI